MAGEGGVRYCEGGIIEEGEDGFVGVGFYVLLGLL